MTIGEDTILDVEDLETVFSTRDADIFAVNQVSFSLRAGEVLGVVGESGSGKSVTMMSLLGLLPSPPAEIRGGRVVFDGRELLRMSEHELRNVRGSQIGFIFQDPMTSLNPVFTVGFQLTESLRRHLRMTRDEARRKAADLLDLVGIPDPSKRLRDFPHQFSGGMRQRVMIAIALACQPKVLIADEPTTALDVTIQAQILELVRDLREKFGMAIIWITHDLGVIAGIADRVIVMYGGQIVEHAPVDELFHNPSHPYTRALLDTVPAVRGKRAPKLNSIKGITPTLTSPPSACAFMPRCRFAFGRCAGEIPLRRELQPGHDVACFLHQDDQAAVNG